MEENARSVVLFTSVSHAIVHTFELSIPILVVIWLLEFSVSTAMLGLVVALGYALFGIGALPGGVLADRYGSRTLILFCLVGMALSFLLLSVASGIVTIAIALAAWGLAASVYHPSGLSLISTGVENRGTAFAYHGMAGNLGIAFGPLLTALLLLNFDWRVVTRLLVVPAVVAVLYALATDFDETAAVSVDGGTDERPSMSLSGFVADSRALFTVGFTLAMFVVMMNGLFYRGALTFLPDVLGGLLPPVTEYARMFDAGSPVAEQFNLASYLYVGLLTVGVGGQYVGGKVSDRVEPTTALAVVFGSLAVVAVGFVPTARLGMPALVAVSAGLGFLLFALQPLYQATIAEQSPPDERGLSYGYTYLVSFGIGAAGAAVSGALLSVFTPATTFGVLAVFPVLGVGFSLLIGRGGDTQPRADSV
ncbi:MFS transporter [Haloarcula sp. S1CR25-12]|uniref:MFS transporter n=1 Tax=Haloarcula saliterrae TaxID=2950534 RepID=A0ABU2FFU5_9EURY|nr:MFS transporter [Haloarcula sp. S1CR25-12]MDS0261131.1 MFS transporter [Haloarcula sp. S1CR25-12]